MNVSVLIPTYNMQDRLPRSITSAIAGLYKTGGEILVIDDGSSDGTGSLPCLRQLNVSYIWRPHAGIAAALNAGIRHAKHEHIAILDCGDVCESWRFWMQSTRLTIGQHLVGVGCRTRILLPNEEEPLCIHRVVESSDQLRAGLRRINLCQHSSMMFRKSALLAVGGYRPFFKMAADYDLLLRLSEHGDLENLRDVTCDRILDVESASFRWARLMEVEAHIARHCAAQRRRGVPDDVATGIAIPPAIGLEPEERQFNAWRSAVARACLVGSDRERAHSWAKAAGNRQLLWLSRLPVPVLETLRDFRFKWVTRS